jgi:hypothetical protein
VAQEENSHLVVDDRCSRTALHRQQSRIVYAVELALLALGEELRTFAELLMRPDLVEGGGEEEVEALGELPHDCA